MQKKKEHLPYATDLIAKARRERVGNQSIYQ